MSLLITLATIALGLFIVITSFQIIGSLILGIAAAKKAREVR